jgi:hypothetical protein
MGGKNVCDNLIGFHMMGILFKIGFFSWEKMCGFHIQKSLDFTGGTTCDVGTLFFRWENV